MTEHHIEAHFVVKSDADIAARSARIDARVIALLAEVIVPPGSSGRERLEAPALAAAIYRGVMALPAVLKKAIEQEGG